MWKKANYGWARRNRSLISVAAASLLRLCIPAVAQVYSGGRSRSVHGTVTDPSGRPVRGAAVEIEDLRTLNIRSFVTQKNGKYHFGELYSNLDCRPRARYHDTFGPAKTPQPVHWAKERNRQSESSGVMSMRTPQAESNTLTQRLIRAASSTHGLTAKLNTTQPPCGCGGAIERRYLDNLDSITGRLRPFSVLFAGVRRGSSPRLSGPP